MEKIIFVIKLIGTKFRNMIKGANILDKDMRLIFKEGILKTTIARTQALLIILLLLQISNIILSKVTNNHPGYSHIYNFGSFFMIVVCIMISIMFVVIKKQEDIPYELRSFIVKSSAIFIVAGTFVFIYAEFHETQTIINYILLISILGITPLISFVEMAITAGVLLTFGIAIGTHAGVQSSYIHLMVLITIIAVYAAQLRYSAELNIFYEKKLLEKKNAELELLSETDALTKLLNRRGLENNTKLLYNLTKRSGGNIGTLVLDIDFFKSYNDKFMHLGGDKCLEKIGRCLKDTIRRSADIIARYGGEEFVIITQNMGPEELLGFAVQVKNAIENLKIEFNHSKDFPYVTVSIGVALIDVDKNITDARVFFKTLIEKSDKELYNAKANGRNCVSFLGNIYK